MSTRNSNTFEILLRNFLPSSNFMASLNEYFLSPANGDNGMIPSILEVDETESKEEDVEVLRSSIPYVFKPKSRCNR